MTRRQLEYEVSRLSDLMADNLGTSEQIAQRHEARLARIRMIESEMLRMQQRHHDQVNPFHSLIIHTITYIYLSLLHNWDLTLAVVGLFPFPNYIDR